MNVTPDPSQSAKRRLASHFSNKKQLRRVLTAHLTAYFSKRSEQRLTALLPSFLTRLVLEEEMIHCRPNTEQRPDCEEARAQTLSLQMTRSGAWTLKCSADATQRSRYLHSRIDPLKEASRQLSEKTINGYESHLGLLGSDLLYLLEAIVTDAQSQHYQTLIIFTHTPDILLLALAFRDLAWLKHFERRIEVFFDGTDCHGVSGSLTDATVTLIQTTMKRAYTEVHAETKSDRPPQVFSSDHNLQNAVPKSLQANHFLIPPKDTFRSWLFVPTREWDLTSRHATSHNNNDHKATHTSRHEPLQHALLKLGQNFYRETFTRYVFEKRWLKNILSNMQSFHYCTPFASLRRSHQGATALIVGAGPSLDAYAAELKHLKTRGQKPQADASVAYPPPILIALDSALPTLSAMEITPDYIVALDGGYYNTLDFSWCKTTATAPATPPATPLEKRSDTNGSTVDKEHVEDNTSYREKEPRLLAHAGVYPLILRNYRGKIYCFTETLDEHSDDSSTQHSFTESILKMIGLDLSRSRVLTGGSVLHAAVGCAYAMGCSRLIFYGVDFACPFYTSHAFHAIHNQVLLHRSDRFHSHTSEVFTHLNNTVIRRNTLVTTQTLLTYATSLGEMVKHLLADKTSPLPQSSQKLDEHGSHPSSPNALAFYTVSPYAPTIQGVTFLKDLRAVRQILDQNTPQSSLPHRVPSPAARSKRAEWINAVTLQERIEEVTAILTAFQREVEALMQALTELPAETPAETPSSISEHSMLTNLNSIPEPLFFIRFLLQTYQTLLHEHSEKSYALLMVAELRRILRITQVKLEFLRTRPGNP